MSGANILFLTVGIIAALAGLLMLVAALRGDPGESQRSTGLLIAGMMILAFGLIMSGFAIAYATTKPYDFNNSAPGA
ncbi:hypothetical protein M8312_11665 [Sphingomonas sp. KRR8]|uniref:hypothetical protein n=1 Tax=Sphingomonas sp. KRR8 TaxID=2942996 RepID=UPI002020B03E|nr:hypothetical protein [Sphingomonas sp. KRR8]URD60433.1 hypothetical protein M8312_11665 [Sphingomonas sp. KRR8]